MDNTGSWRIPLGITFFWGLLLGLGILLFPESPRYDFRHGRVETAKRTMSKLYGVPENHRVIVHEVLEIQEQLEAEQGSLGGVYGWVEMFQAPRMPYRIVLGIVLQALQQLTGANYFFYYVSLERSVLNPGKKPPCLPYRTRGRPSSMARESAMSSLHR